MTNSAIQRIEDAYQAQLNRTFYAAWPENPRAYAEDAGAKGLEAFQKSLANNFKGLDDSGSHHWIGEEVSPFLQQGLGIQYPAFTTEVLLEKATSAQQTWSKTSVDQRADLLVACLDEWPNVFLRLPTQRCILQGRVM